MTNAEFQVKLKNMYADFPMIAKRKQKTFNEFVYVLRMSGEDYQINTYNDNEPGSCTCIPDVKETFIPVKSLAQKVVSVEFDEETYEEMGIQLLLVELEDSEGDCFGKVVWCNDDLENALEVQGYPVTENNIDELRRRCERHFFTDCMIERGLDYIYDQIGEGDGWDE